ncbi:hypothetical protein CH063_07435 [Colletotrichum higginsianum]|uniref:Uncharacterized protein n=1 Tax=Colletotrichum higginsianum (strain IMI 349063) TaxID=759273 RepID=H1V660_COLHI|nr:hypothetical protein CH063_07435 [Colletotrichum higginsianum]
MGVDHRLDIVGRRASEGDRRVKGLESCFWRDVRTVVIGRRQPNGAPLSFFSGRWSVVSGKWLVVNSGGAREPNRGGMGWHVWVGLSECLELFIFRLSLLLSLSLSSSIVHCSLSIPNT